MDALDLGLLSAAAFGAGFIDAVAGGGGLITTPSLLLVLPEAAIATVLGTNKCVSIVGTGAAALTYAGRLPLATALLVPAVLTALPAAFLGAALVSRLDPLLVRPAILLALALVALYTACRPALGLAARDVPPSRQPWLGAALGAFLGFYDGLLGPGTGSFLTLGLVGLAGFEFLAASAHARVINCATNLGAVLWFAPHGTVLWAAVPLMAVANLGGGVLGSRLALAKGSRWVRRIFLTVVIALILRLGWSVLRGQ